MNSVSFKATSCFLGTVFALALLACSLSTSVRAEDSSDVPCPTDLSEAPEKFKKEFEECMRSQDAKREAKLKADREILAAKFKTHPEQLKDPKLCDKLLVEKDKNSHDLFPYTQDSYYMMLACQDVTGITAENERVRATDCASGNPNGPCAMGRRIMEESRQKVEKDLDAFVAAGHSHDAQDREYEERRDVITSQSIQEWDTDKKIQNLRKQFQQEDQQRRIDGEQKDADGAEDDSAMDHAIAHDALFNGNYESARQWEEKAHIDGQ